MAATAAAVSAVIVAWHFPNENLRRERSRSKLLGTLACIDVLKRISDALKSVKFNDIPSDDVAKSFRQAMTEIETFLPENSVISTYGALAKPVALIAIIVRGRSRKLSLEASAKELQTESDVLVDEVRVLVNEVIEACDSTIAAARRQIEKIDFVE